MNYDLYQNKIQTTQHYIINFIKNIVKIKGAINFDNFISTFGFTGFMFEEKSIISPLLQPIFLAKE